MCIITIGEDGLDLRLVALLELDDGPSCKCGQHGDSALRTASCYRTVLNIEVKGFPDLCSES